MVARSKPTNKSKSKAFQLWKPSSKAFQLCPHSRKDIREARSRAEAAKEDADLAAHAAMIRRLGKRILEDIVHIGCRLKEAKDILRHGGWEAWLEKEFGWSADTALNFMRVYEFSQDCKSRNFRDLRIAPSALYVLARPSTPQTVKNEITKRAEAGEKITLKTVKKALADPIIEADLPQPAATPAERNNKRVAARITELNNEFIKLAKFARPGTIIEPEVLADLRALYAPMREKLKEGRDRYSFIIDDLCGDEPAPVESPTPTAEPAQGRGGLKCAWETPVGGMAAGTRCPAASPRGQGAEIAMRRNKSGRSIKKPGQSGRSCRSMTASSKR